MFNAVKDAFKIDYENLNKGGLFGKGVQTETTDATIKIDIPNFKLNSIKFF